jgi:hypothetical protein
MKRYDTTNKKILFKWLNIVALLFIILSCESSPDKKTKNITADSFMIFYKKTFLGKDTILLFNGLPYYSLKNCLFKVRFEPEFNQFNKEDFLIEPEITKKIWNKENIPDKISLLKSSDLPSNKTFEEWVNFRKKFGNGYYAMSYPIVSNDLNYIIFYCEYNCGDRCGYGRLGLYTKDNNGWKLVKYYCNWIN